MPVGEASWVWFFPVVHFSFVDFFLLGPSSQESPSKLLYSATYDYWLLVMSSIFFFHASLMPIKCDVCIQVKERQGHAENLYSHLTICFINCLRSNLLPLVFIWTVAFLRTEASPLFCGMLRAIQKCHLTKERKKKKKWKSPLQFRLWHFLKAARKWWSFTSNCQMHLPKSFLAM